MFDSLHRNPLENNPYNSKKVTLSLSSAIVLFISVLMEQEDSLISWLSRINRLHCWFNDHVDLRVQLAEVKQSPNILVNYERKWIFIY